jgi:glycosyltransferase involved in cell wall biosynthesis
MTTGETVSVVIPTRDRWPLLSTHALPSALGQEDVDLEVIVVDDGSSDGTSDHVARLSDPRVRVVRHDTAQGPAAARNAGIAAARGDWIAFLDDDDLWSPRKLRTQVEAARGADWCYCAAVVVDDRLEVIDVLPLAEAHTLVPALRHGNVVGAGSSSVIVRAGVLRRTGAFDESLYYVEDWDLWFRLAQAGRAVACGEQLVATLDHAERALFRNRAAVLRGISAFLTRIGADRDAHRSAAEWVANEHHRAGHRRRASLLYLRVAFRHRSVGNLPPALGALFGQRGMEATAQVLSKVGRGSHLDLSRHPTHSAPPWLVALRDSRRLGAH